MTAESKRRTSHHGSPITTATAAALLLFAFARGAFALELNEATRAQLEQLNGVGVAMADRILAERERAAFKDWDDLARRVKGMRGARIERLQAQGVTVNGIPGARAGNEERKR
jgi:competence protein ComEA